MAYTITDITVLVEFHLVVSAADEDIAQANLAQLVQQLELLAHRPHWRKATWVFRDWCGCSVDTDLIHPDGHHYADDGDFYCVDCWEVVAGTPSSWRSSRTPSRGSRYPTA